MARRLKGLSAEALKKARSDLQQDLLRGKRIVSTGAGDINAAFTLVEAAIKGIDEINYELACMGEEEAADVIPHSHVSVSLPRV